MDLVWRHKLNFESMKPEAFRVTRNAITTLQSQQTPKEASFMIQSLLSPSGVVSER